MGCHCLLQREEFLVSNEQRPGMLLGASLVARLVKILPAAQETQVYPWVGKISWRWAWQPAPIHSPGESHGQRSLAGYSPQGHTESTCLSDCSSRDAVHILQCTARPHKQSCPSQGCKVLRLRAQPLLHRSKIAICS